MDTPQYAPKQYLGSAVLNANDAALSSSVTDAFAALCGAGLINFSSTQFSNPSALNATVTFSTSFMAIFNGGGYLGLSQAHGVSPNSDTQVYSINLSPYVPGSGSQTVYLYISYFSLGMSPSTNVGPPRGHPDYDPSFQATVSNTFNRDSFSLSAGTSLPAGSFEIARTVLSAGQTTGVSFNTSNVIKASAYQDGFLNSILYTSADYTSGVADKGRAIFIQTAGSTLTLPTFSGPQAPLSYSNLVYNATLGVAYVRTPTGIFIGEQYGGETTLTINPWECISLLSDGSNWIVVSGPANLAPVYSAITAESTARAAAVSAEATTRSTADTTLQSNINAEATTRSAADTTLQGNINAEAAARNAEDTTLQGNIDAEATARNAEDVSLSDYIGAVNTNLSAEGAARIAAVSAEATTRSAADTTLQGNIDAEATARNAEDVSLSDYIGAVNTNLSAEGAARASADTALQTQITNNNTGRLLNIQQFSASGTYTPSAGTNVIIIEGCGAGGGGGGASATNGSQYSVGSGGASGAWGRTNRFNNSSQLTLVIGAGGGVPSGAAGYSGGATTVSIAGGALILTLPGGGGGPTAIGPTGVNFQANQGANGGPPTCTKGMLYKSAGNNGQNGIVVPPMVISGFGGSSPYGTYGGNLSSGAGNAASDYGAGGSGAANQPSASAQGGGLGGGGFIMIYEYT